MFRVLCTMVRNLQDTAGNTRKELASSLREAKDTARRLEREYNRLKTKEVERP